MPIIILMSTLSLGNILNAGFDQVFNLYNSVVYESGDILDTLVYRIGFGSGQFGLSSAAGLFKSLVSAVLVVISYKVAYKTSGGSRYCRDASQVFRPRRDGTAHTLPQLMSQSVDEALASCGDLKLVSGRLRTLHDLGLGYLTLGEATPSLSGGEAQRLKLASEMGRGQGDTIFVFDEPPIGLHPLDVQTLLAVFQRLIDSGATVLVIEHDLDLIRSADYVVDMGPGGGDEGGRIVACGTPEQIRACPQSVTGRYL